MTHHLVTKRLQAGSVTDKTFGCPTCRQNWVLAYREHEKVLSYCCMPKQRAVESRAFKGKATPFGVAGYDFIETLKAMHGGSLKS